MKKVTLLLYLSCLLAACKSKEPNPAALTPEALRGRSVLTYANTQYNKSYQVTEYNQYGIPLTAKTAAAMSEGVSPSGTYQRHQSGL